MLIEICPLVIKPNTTESPKVDSRPIRAQKEDPPFHIFTLPIHSLKLGLMQ